ncbi:antitoxin Xre/MbcA/ParS toxin-binding domain-containing protein [Halomonas sp. HK25]|uniref:antitoxin Xre/MbcA/ParS toxin-binding domain-containing protein n=1 Tax=Halomonas sp. HK25 TaxID=3394321 RepID=UPI0039FC17C3
MSTAELHGVVTEGLDPAVFDDTAEFIRTVRRGVPGQLIREAIDALGNTPEARELFVTLLETTSGNLHRYYKRAALGRTASEEVLDTLRLVRYAQAVFDDAGVAADWLAAPIPALAGETPLALCDTFQGRQLVRDALGKIEYGEFS